jgi:hypothetical protein
MSFCVMNPIHVYPSKLSHALQHFRERKSILDLSSYHSRKCICRGGSFKILKSYIPINLCRSSRFFLLKKSRPLTLPTVKLHSQHRLLHGSQKGSRFYLCSLIHITSPSSAISASDVISRDAEPSTKSLTTREYLPLTPFHWLESLIPSTDLQASTRLPALPSLVPSSAKLFFHPLTRWSRPRTPNTTPTSRPKAHRPAFSATVKPSPQTPPPPRRGP